MIPYDDLVVALSAWRARQGLPVVRSAAAAQPARARPAAAAAPAPAPAPAAPPARATPARPAAAQVPAASDFDEPALVEDGDDNDSGEDYVMQLGENAAEPTAISGVPEPVPTGGRGKRGKRW
jgi:2-oxoglutarate dehydrogenase E2 component (dihydrolipoamide succinyltransferase)